LHRLRLATGHAQGSLQRLPGCSFWGTGATSSSPRCSVAGSVRSTRPSIWRT